MISGILINIDVDDLEAAEAFYCSAWGLWVSRRFGSDVLELSGLGVPCYLLKKSEGTAAFHGGSCTRDYSRHWTPLHLDITVPDIQAAYERALTAGAQAETEIRTVPYGKIVVMADPFGHGFCLIEFNEKGYDALAPLLAEPR